MPIGSDGLVVLDYFQGNRRPHTDPYGRGQISGLSLGHGQGHVFRAIIEGICYGTEDVFRTMRVREFEPKLTVVSGAPAKSDLWMQMHADVSNVPISLTRVSEGPVLDAAMPAVVGAGIYPDIRPANRLYILFPPQVEQQCRERAYNSVHLPAETKTGLQEVQDEATVPAVVDRLICQAIAQVLTPIFDPNFHPHSFGFGPGRSQHHAVERARQFIADDAGVVRRF